MVSYVAYASVTNDDNRRQRPLLVWSPYIMCRRVSSKRWQHSQYYVTVTYAYAASVSSIDCFLNEH